MELVPAVAAWAAATVCQFTPVASNELGRRFCTRGGTDTSEFAKELSTDSQVLLPGDPGFKEASSRWNVFDQPTASVIVIPSVAEDVAKSVCQTLNPHTCLG